MRAEGTRRQREPPSDFLARLLGSKSWLDFLVGSESKRGAQLARVSRAPSRAERPLRSDWLAAASHVRPAQAVHGRRRSRRSNRHINGMRWSQLGHSSVTAPTKGAESAVCLCVVQAWLIWPCTRREARRVLAAAVWVLMALCVMVCPPARAHRSAAVSCICWRVARPPRSSAHIRHIRLESGLRATSSIDQ